MSKDLVPESAYTGRSHTMVMVDYSSRVVPEVKVSIDTPYYKGEVLALCVEKPLVGLIIGNIPGARERNNPDINCVPALAVQTKAQAKREGVTSKLKTLSIIDRTITSAHVSNAQKDDVSLTTTRSRCEANEIIGKATFLKKNNLFYRKFSSPKVEQGKIFEQLIVPEQYRELVNLFLQGIYQLRATYAKYCRNTIGQVSIETLNALYSHAKFAIAVYLKVRWTEICQIEKT